MSNKSSISTELPAYAGYVFPIFTYCSQAWYASKTNLSKFESLQIKATKWIVNGQVSGFKERLLKLKLPPLSMYAQMQDLLLLISLDWKEYDVEIENMKRKNQSNNRQNSRGEFEIKNNRLAKADEKLRRSTQQANNHQHLLGIFHKKFLSTEQVPLANNVQMWNM